MSLAYVFVRKERKFDTVLASAICRLDEDLTSYSPVDTSTLTSDAGKNNKYGIIDNDQMKQIFVCFTGETEDEIATKKATVGRLKLSNPRSLGDLVIPLAGLLKRQELDESKLRKTKKTRAQLSVIQSRQDALHKTKCSTEESSKSTDKQSENVESNGKSGGGEVSTAKTLVLDGLLETGKHNEPQSNTKSTKIVQQTESQAGKPKDLPKQKSSSGKSSKSKGKSPRKPRESKIRGKQSHPNETQKFTISLEVEQGTSATQLVSHDQSGTEQHQEQHTSILCGGGTEGQSNGSIIGADIPTTANKTLVTNSVSKESPTSFAELDRTHMETADISNNNSQASKIQTGKLIDGTIPGESPVLTCCSNCKCEEALSIASKHFTILQDMQQKLSALCVAFQNDPSPSSSLKSSRLCPIAVTSSIVEDKDGDDSDEQSSTTEIPEGSIYIGVINGQKSFVSKKELAKADKKPTYRARLQMVVQLVWPEGDYGAYSLTGEDGKKKVSSSHINAVHQLLNLLNWKKLPLKPMKYNKKTLDPLSEGYNRRQLGKFLSGTETEEEKPNPKRMRQQTDNEDDEDVSVPPKSRRTKNMFSDSESEIEYDLALV